MSDSSHKEPTPLAMRLATKLAHEMWDGLVARKHSDGMIPNIARAIDESGVAEVDRYFRSTVCGKDCYCTHCETGRIVLGQPGGEGGE